MCVSSGPILPRGALYFAQIHHGGLLCKNFEIAATAVLLFQGLSDLKVARRMKA
jgi:hypothetical protein